MSELTMALCLPLILAASAGTTYFVLRKIERWAPERVATVALPAMFAAFSLPLIVGGAILGEGPLPDSLIFMGMFGLILSPLFIPFGKWIL